MLPTTIARHLSPAQRQCLIAHIDKPQPLVIKDAESNGLYKTKMVLCEKQLLCPTDNSPRPKSLRMTRLGREIVCHVLGEYADFLMAAGCLEPLTRTQLFANIKVASQRKPPCNTTISRADAIPEESYAPNTLRNRAASIRLLYLLEHGS